MKSNPLRMACTLGLAVLGLMYGCLIGLLALGLAGGGHGWNSAAISGVGVVLVPAFGAALALPRRGRRGVLLLVAASMLMADGFLALATWGEGVTYVRRVWASAPASLCLWAALWGAWQVAVLGMLCYDAVDGGKNGVGKNGVGSYEPRH